MVTANRRTLAQGALTTALKTRHKLKLPLNEAVDIYSVADRLEVNVRFLNAPTLEGMYVREDRLIVLSAERPAGRQVFSCAHELGHHLYGHGTRVDEVRDRSGSESQAFQPDEYLVDRFASYLLMPSLAVNRGFNVRRYDIRHPTPEQVYEVASWLGVGYRTLVEHLQFGLTMTDATMTAQLRQFTPQKLRRSLLGQDSAAPLIVANAHWTGRAIDMQVGDLLLLQGFTAAEVEGYNLEVLSNDPRGLLVAAILPGIGKVSDAASNWAVFVRSSRHNYVGLSEYRHWDDPDAQEGHHD